MSTEEFLRHYETNDLLRFLTCGSVDDGKSTLIGRLLHDTGRIYDDHMRALERESKVHGTQAGAVDLALLVDGLKSEREQGITIDVAWRYFATGRRTFIIADCPGHEQYTRNMATGASHCSLAISLIDARKGVTTQTRRHAFIASLLGIHHIVAAVNKMDLVGFSESRFREVEADFLSYCTRLGVRDSVALPICALDGDNVVKRSDRIPWYSGNPLMELLETVPLDASSAESAFRMPVQCSIRPNSEFRGIAGTIASGSIKPGDQVRVHPSGKLTRVRRIASQTGDLSLARAPQAALLVLEDEVDCSRGDVLSCVGDEPRRESRVEADLVWMSQTPLVPGSEWLVKLGTKTSDCRVARIVWESCVDTLEHKPASSMAMNAIGRVELELAEPFVVEDYSQCRSLGALILIDRVNNETAAAGMIRLSAQLEQAHWEKTAALAAPIADSSITRAERATRYSQTPMTLLLCGRPGAGKTAIASAIERKLFDAGHACVTLDGKSLRQSLSRDLGFEPAARSENLRRAMEIARLLNSQGLIVIASMVAPQDEARRRARELIGGDRFVLVHVLGGDGQRNGGEPGPDHTPRAVREPRLSRDPCEFEVPQSADVVIAAHSSPTAAADLLLSHLTGLGLLR